MPVFLYWTHHILSTFLVTGDGTVTFRAGTDEAAMRSTALVPVSVNYCPHTNSGLISMILFIVPRGTQDHNCFQSKPHQSVSNITPETPLCLQSASLCPLLPFSLRRWVESTDLFRGNSLGRAELFRGQRRVV